MTKCTDGCLCARHDKTRYTGNPNWAEDFDEARLIRYLRALQRRTAQSQTVVRKRPAPAAMPEETSPLPAKPSAQPIKRGRPRMVDPSKMSRRTKFRRQAEKAKIK